MRPSVTGRSCIGSNYMSKLFCKAVVLRMEIQIITIIMKEIMERKDSMNDPVWSSWKEM